uniref:NDNF_C domain-containing protein n=1 Tax=Ascaris lumbricoides TaxID=6252 RepID=A0A0M3IBD8_ASCLU
MKIFLFLSAVLAICSFAYAITMTVPILADGIEHIIQLNPSQSTRLKLQFNMPGPHYPLWMYVTPCGGSVHWQLFHTQAPRDIERIANVHPKAAKFNYLSHEHIPSLSEVESNTVAEPLSLLAGEADDKRMSFYTQHLDSESVVLVLSSNVHSTARVFITTEKWRLDEHYPPRPTDTTVSYQVANYHRHNEFNDAATVRIKWNIPLEIEAMNSSTNTDGTPLNRYRFCAVVSRKQPDWTICDELGENLESIHCVSQSFNTLDIDNMRTGRRYYVTVFFRDALSGGTSALRPVEIFLPDMGTPKEKQKKEKTSKRRDKESRLSDARLQAGKLAGFKGATQSFDFSVRYRSADQQKVLLVLHACDGYIRVAIYRNGRLLRRSDPFSGFRRFLVMNALSGHLTIQIINDDSKPKVFRLWASTNPERSPYPQLPDDTSIKETRRSCSSTTLQWLKAADADIRYCLYRRKETVHYLEELVSKHANLCSGKMPETDLVGCYTHFADRQMNLNQPSKGYLSVADDYGSDDIDGIIETTVSDLSPDTTYRFDLLAEPVHRAHSQQLPYRTVWVKTRAFC